MHVALLYFVDCPNWREAGHRLRAALVEIGHPDAEISFVQVETEAEAATSGFGGSPTFLVDGTDLFDPPVAGGLTCRIYASVTGVSGVPAVTDLVTALRERALA